MSQIISLSFDKTPVSFNSNGYLNATSIAAKFNKRAADYLRSQSTKDYIAAITRKRVTEQNQLVIIKKGGFPEEQGTWLHNKLAIDFARWLNPDFAVWCDEQIEAILHPHQPPQTQLATPAQKLQIRRLVEVKAKSIGGGRCDYSIVWRKVQDECKFNKLDELTPAAYQMACKFFNVEPLTGEWEHEQPAALPAPIPEGMQLIPKMRDDEYYWKDKIHELNPINNHGSYKSRTIHHKPEATILVPFTIDSKDKTWVMYLRNGMLHRREQMFATHAHEIDGWRLA